MLLENLTLRNVLWTQTSFAVSGSESSNRPAVLPPEQPVLAPW